MDYNSIIEKCENKLNKAYSEDTLYEFISVKIGELLSSCDIDQLLNEDDKIRLNKLIKYNNYLEIFIDLKEELGSVNDLDHYNIVKKELEKLGKVFSGYPVAQRIYKELRELNEKLNFISQKTEARHSYKLNERIIYLEKRSPRCPKDHDMVVRQGGVDGYFWGCSHFPDCFFTKKLSDKEWEYLFSDKRLKNTEKTLEKNTTENDDYISTTVLAINHGLMQHELFSFFAAIKWIEKIDRRWKLTNLGLRKGGIYKTTKGGISYIAWPQDVIEKQNLTDKINIQKNNELDPKSSFENKDSETTDYAELETDQITCENTATIQETDVFEMPQEKLIKYGTNALNKWELLALIVRTGTQTENVLDLCKNIMEKYSLLELSEINLHELKKIHGIGEAQACRLLAVFELYNRLKIEEENNRTKT